MADDDMFGRWRSAAGRVAHALGRHEAAARAGDDRLARGAQGGFKARWAALVRASDRLLNFFTTGPRAGAAEPQALTVLVRGWSRFVPPRLPRDAAHVRHFIGAARIEIEGPEPSPAGQAPAPAAAPPDPAPEATWLVGSRRALNRALGKSSSYSDYLERAQAAGELELRREGDKLAIRLADPAEHRRAAAALARLRGGPGV